MNIFVFISVFFFALAYVRFATTAPVDPEDRNDDDDDNDGSPTAPSLEEIDDETFKDDEAIVTPGPGVQVPSIRPIVIMHGLISSSYTLQVLAGRIKRYQPNAKISMINIFTYMSSFTDCQTQTQALIREVRLRSKETPYGITLICYSQGGILCRALLEEMDDHRVHTFISLAGPLAGQFGVSKFLFDWYMRSKYDVWKYVYTSWGQTFSFANYWKDPYHYTEYLRINHYLPVLDNEVNHPNAERYKTNFLRTKRIVLIGGKDDGVIEPWQSCHFGFHPNGSDRTVLNFNETRAYTKDWYGLKTLHSRGGIAIHSIPGVEHLQWHQAEPVFREAVLPYL